MASDRLERRQIAQPEARYGAGGGIICDQLFMYGGYLKSFDRGGPYPCRSSQVDIFRSSVVKWTVSETSGLGPESLWSYACAIIGTMLYSYGGYNGSSFSSALCQLDATTAHWTTLQSASPTEGPIAKANAAMIAIDSERLCVMGGVGVPSGTRRAAGSKFVPNLFATDGRGFTNEMHLYNIKQGNYLRVHGVHATWPPQ